MYLKEMLERLRHININPTLVQLQLMKEKLCKQRIEISRHIKSEPWTGKQLEAVLKSLKKGKCRDPQGYINELFKPGWQGQICKNQF